MPNPDMKIYAMHGVFWSAFGIATVVLRLLYGRGREKPASAPMAGEAHTARHSRALIAFHCVAFGVMYFGIARAVFGHRVPAWFDGHQALGTLVIAMGAALMVFTLVYFRSWRFRATLEPGHQLATGGPFRLLRHPIYMSLNLLALGSAIYIPSVLLWISVVLMVIGSDLRGRAEERILADAFGEAYRSYSRGTSRFVPYVY
jgi:protein-S-isoprenylcysteine O-methyltransferase Ste14